MNDIHDRFRREGLVRPRDGRVLAGVVAGLGRRFGIDPWPARLLFVLLLLVALRAGASGLGLDLAARLSFGLLLMIAAQPWLWLIWNCGMNLPFESHV